jgi:chemotaxis protein methyltransferase CheR
VPGGYLVVSANELSISSFPGFERVELGKAFCFRKPTGKPSWAGKPSVPPRPERRRTDLSRLRANPAARPAIPPGAGAPPPPPAPRAAAETAVDPLAAARLCADAGRFDEAARHCRAALERDPMGPAGYYLYGVVLQEAGDPVNAAREFRRAIYLDPDFVAPYVSLGQILHGAGNRAEARRHLSNALAILGRYPDDEIVRESGGTTVGALAAMIRSIEPGADSGNGQGDE